MATIITQTVNVELSTGKVIPTAFVHQNDTARTIIFKVTSNGMPWDLSDCTIKFAYKSPIVDGQYTVISGNSMVSGEVESEETSWVYFTPTIDYTRISGVGLLTMIITPTSGTVRPVNIRLAVQKSADGADVVAGASDFPTELQEIAEDWLEENISIQIDDTLSVSGKAADAKVTGDEISNLNSELINSELFNILSFLTYAKPVYPTNGIQFTYISQAKYSIVGTSTGTIAFDFCNSLTSLPDGIIQGETYRVSIKGINNFQARLFFSTNGTSWDEQQKTITSNGTTFINVPSNAQGMLFRIYIQSGVTLNTVFEASIVKINNNTVESAVEVINESFNGVYQNKIDTVGNISITSNGWNFYSSTARARTNENNTYHLYEGDVIKNTNPALIRMYVGYRGSTGNYYYAGWLQEDFTIPFECDCVILLSYVNESTISSADELSQYVYVVDREHAIANIEKDNSELTANVKSVNHQGYNYFAPNESLPAYRLSKKYGFNIVECDVQKTSDGVYVLNHDNDISKTGTFYNITGNTPVLVTTETLISNLTYQQLITNYDIRKSLNDKYTGTKVARFDDFILLCKHLGLHAYVELKTGGTSDTQALHDIVKNYGMLKNVTWISSLINYLNQMKVYDGSVRLGYVVQNVTAETIAEAQTVQTENNEVFMDANYTNLTTESVDLCINAGLELEAWIVNTNTAMTNLNPYVTRVTTDRLKYSDVFENT